jgi:hypothetical protein
MNSEKCVFRAWHSDSTMAKRAGLIRNPFMSVGFHFDSFDRPFSFAEFPPIDCIGGVIYLSFCWTPDCRAHPSSWDSANRERNPSTNVMAFVAFSGAILSASLQSSSALPASSSISCNRSFVNAAPNAQLAPSIFSLIPPPVLG